MRIHDWAARLGMDDRKSRGPENFWTICPCHSDTKPSLHVYVGQKTGEIVMKCFVCGAKGADVCKALDLPLSEVMCDAMTGEARSSASSAPHKTPRTARSARPYKTGARLGEYTITNVYEYQRQDGTVVLRKARGESYDEQGTRTGKTFAMQSLGADGKWYNTEGIYGNLLYHLPDVLAAAKAGDQILIAEGEKDVDNLRAIGFCATCGLHGGGIDKGEGLNGKWCDDHARAFDGAADVVVIADNDAAGEGIARWICKSLKARVKRLRLLRIADSCDQLPKHGDFTDWVQLLKGQGVRTKREIRERLGQMIDAVPDWTPEDRRTFPEEATQEQKEEAPKRARKTKPPKDEDGGEEEYESYHGSTMYCIKQGRLAVREARGGARCLCDFVPEPKHVITRDDGSTRRTDFVIGGVNARGRALPDAIVEGVDRFAAMRWPMEAWQHDGNIKPVRNAQQMILDAINAAGQRCASVMSIYSHTGMRKVGGKLCYLYNGGAIGADNVSVELPGSLSKYDLSAVDGITREDAAMSEVMLLDGFPARIIYPLMAQAYLAPLYSVFEDMQQPPSYCVMVVGESNSGKSTLCGYVLSHFGRFYNRAFPASFEDSVNSARDKLFWAKDALIVVDDYRKGEGDGRQRNPHDLMANTIISAVADRSGRDRLNERKELSGARPCRGMCIMTGEDVPRVSPSRRLRLYQINVALGDIYKQSASELEPYRMIARAGTYRACMRGYIESLIARWDGIEDELALRLDRAAERMQSVIARREGRLMECATHLMVGIELMLDFLISCGVMDEVGKAQRLETAAAAIAHNINVQGASVDADKPESIWLATLRSLMATRSVTMLAPDELGDGFRAGVIGYKRDNEYWIIPEAADEQICERLRKGGVSLGASRQSILRALMSAGMIIPQRRKGSDAGSPTSSVHLPSGRSGRVIRMPRWVLDDPDNPPEPEKMGFTRADSEQLPMQWRPGNDRS